MRGSSRRCPRQYCWIPSWTSCTVVSSLVVTMFSPADATTSTTTNTTTSTTTTAIADTFTRVHVFGAADPRPIVKIGTALTLDSTSRWRTHGKSQRRTWQIFFEWLNYKRGGVKINGVYHKVELIMIGDDSNADKVRHVHRWLCQQGITLMFAPYSSGLTKIAAQEANACGALMIAPNAASTSVFTPNPLVFGTTTPATKYVVPAFEAVGTMVTSMAIFYEEGGFTGIDSGACSVAQTQAARKGIYYTQTNDVDAFVIPSDPTAADFTRIVNGLKTAGKNGQPPDFILGCVYAAACDSILQEMERQQFSVKITMSMQCVTASGFMRKVGEGGRYIGGIAPWMTTMHLPSDFGNWSAASYSSEYEYRFGELPSYQAASSWASAEIMISSIEKANSVEPEAIATVLKQTTYNTVFGRIAFDNNRQSNMDFKIVQFFVGDVLAPRVVYPIELRVSSVFFPIPSWHDRPCFNDDPTWSYFGYQSNQIVLFGAEATCNPCPDDEVAQFSNVTQQRECQACPSGTRASEEGTQGKTLAGIDIVIRQCIKNCPPGEVAPDQTECEQCTPGTYQLNSNCVQCAPGRYTYDLGNAACLNCPVGKFANNSGHTECERCPPGKSNSQQGEALCDECPVGKFTVSEGGSECQLCDPGMVAATIGQSSCYECAAGSYSVWGAVSCDLCPIGRYQPDPRQDACNSVITGAAAPRVGMTEAENQKMYWAHRVWSYTNGTLKEWELCKFTPDACLEEEQCNPGNTGVQCQSCIPGYSRETPGSTCWTCWNRIYYAVITFIVASCIMAICIFLAYLSKKAADRPQDMHSIIFKLLLNHIITMNVVSMMLQEIVASAKDLSQDATVWSNRIRMSFDWGDGTIPSTTKLWNVECLLTTFRTASQQASLDVLYSANHSSYLSPELSADREVLRNLLRNDELVCVAFWFMWPFVLVIMSTFVGWVWLQRRLAREKDNFVAALEFYKNVSENGFQKARKKLMKDYWESYVKLYFANMNDLFWPARHARRYLSKRPRLVDMHHFWKECQPIRAAVFFLTFGSSVRGAARALKCVVLEDDGSQVYLYRSEVTCSATDAVFLAAAASMFIYGVLYPALVFYWIKTTKQLLAKDAKGGLKELNEQWGLMVNGYKTECWYWEVVVYLRKGLSYMLYAAPFQWWTEEARILCFLVMALCFACLHSAFDPYERRSDGLLSKIESYQLAIWILSVILLKFTQASTSNESAILVPLAIALMHYFFVIWLAMLILESIFTGMQAGWDHEAVNNMKSGWRKSLYLYIIDIPKKKAERQPTLTMDHLYGWVSAYNGGVGGFGELSIPSVPKGKFAHAHHNAHRPPVSLGAQAAEYLANHVRATQYPKAKRIVPASGKARSRIQDAIHAAMGTIAMKQYPNSNKTNSTFSVSLLDFVLRAAFTLHFEEPLQGNQKTHTNEATEVSEIITREAMKAKDPIKLLMDKDPVEDDDKAAADDSQLMQDGSRMEEHLNTDRGLEVIFTKIQLNRQKRKALAENQMQANEGGQDDEGNGEAEVKTKETRESKEQKLMEERLSKRVDLMFSTAPYRRELSLEEMQLKLLQIQHTPDDELMKWLDIFEAHWGIEKAKNADELRHLSGQFEVCREEKIQQDDSAALAVAAGGEFFSTPSGGAGTQVDPKIITRELRKVLGDAYGLHSIADGERQPGRNGHVEDEGEIDISQLPNDDKWIIMAIAIGFAKWSLPLPMLIPALQNYFDKFVKKREKELVEFAKERQNLERQFAENGISVPTDEQLLMFAREKGEDLSPFMEMRVPQAKQKALRS